jgi:hypothetical protein
MNEARSLALPAMKFAGNRLRVLLFSFTAAFRNAEPPQSCSQWAQNPSVCMSGSSPEQKEHQTRREQKGAENFDGCDTLAEDQARHKN